MDDNRDDQIQPIPVQVTSRRPATVGVPVFFGYLIGIVGLVNADDRLQAAVDWEHHYRASYVLKHGAAFASPGYLYVFGVIDLLIGVLLIFGARRASTGVTSTVLIVGFLATEAVAISSFWRGSSLRDVLIVVVIPTLMLALLLSAPSRKFFTGQAR